MSKLSSRSSKARKSWEKHLSTFQSSSLSGAAYCRRHGLNYTTFAKWRQRLSLEANSSPSVFARVEASATITHSAEFQIRLPNGVMARMTGLPDPEWLLKLGGGVL